MKKDGPFELLTSFDVVFPDDARHTDFLDTFKGKYCEKFFYYDPALTDRNLWQTSPTLVPGEKFRVLVLRAMSDVSEEEYIDYLNTKGAVFLGAHGLCFLYLKAPMEGLRMHNKRFVSCGVNMAACITTSPKGHSQFSVCGAGEEDLATDDFLLSFIPIE